MGKLLRYLLVLFWLLALAPPGTLAAEAGLQPLAVQTSIEPQRLAQDQAKEKSGINSVANSPTEDLIAAGAADTRIFLWDSANGQLRYELAGHAGAEVSAVAFSPDGKILASAGRDSVIRLWDAAGGTQIRELAGHEQPARTLAFSPHGALLASSGEDSRVLLWDVATGRLQTVLTQNPDFLSKLAFSPNGQWLAGASHDGRITVWDVATGEARATLRGHEAEVTDIAFSPDGATLASASADATIRLWDFATGTQRAVVRGPAQRMTSVAYSPDGQVLASAGADKMVTLRDPLTGRVQRTLNGHQGGVTGLAFTPDSHRLDSSSEDNQVIQWDVASGRPVRTFVPPAKAAGAGLPDGARAAAMTSEVESAAAAALSDGPGGPILIAVPSGSSFGRYYGEILLNEGFNAYTIAELASITPATLTSYDLVILAQASLSAAQAGMFGDWVAAGGKLIAMRPDKQLAPLLGLADAGGTLADGYLRVNTGRIPGNGIVSETIQYHGEADRYALDGAALLATLYGSAGAVTSHPAVTLTGVGSAGGQAAAFTFDLARSVAYTRQGNPAWSGQERDGFTPIRSDDLYFGASAGDPQRNWVDLDKVAIPQADEQMRLLANLITSMNLSKKPLPRFWYFPRGFKAVVVMTGDDHGNNGTAGRFDQFLASSPAGCNVDDWECIRGTSYVYPGTPLTDAQAAAYAAQGFEIGLHVSTTCQDWASASLASTYSSQLATWSTQYPSLPAPQTNRTHCIVWSDWGTQARVSFDHGIRLDTNYYYWPPSWITNRPGFFTGSGMPMRFVDLDGSLIDVYQAASQMTDESGQSYPYTIDALLDAALGPEGYYGAFTINAHTDVASSSEASAVVASSQARGVPIVSARQMLAWLDGRNNSAFANMAWDGGTLSFTVNPGAGANGLQVMIPVHSQSGTLAGLTRDGSTVSYTTQNIKGVEYAFAAAAAGSYAATYQSDTIAPELLGTVAAAGATGVDTGANVLASFSEAMDPATINGATFQLRDPSDNLIPGAVTYHAATRSAILVPDAALAPGTTYTARLAGAGSAPRATDLAGNSLGADRTWSFTTSTGPACPCTIWDAGATPAVASENDPNAVELGVKFRSDVAGTISGIRFFKGPGNSGVHTGNLWTSTGELLATATFTNETASGWQQVNFAAPVPIAADTVYVASYHTSVGYYAADSAYFASAGTDRAPLHALRDGESGGNGVYAYGSSRFPTNVYNATNYWMDVVFNLAAPDTTAPAVAATDPLAGANGVDIRAAVRATFSEPVDSGSIGAVTFKLRDPADAVIPAAITYNSATNSAALQPDNALSQNTTYTARVLGGASGVKDLAGNPMVNDFTWSFTTGADPCSNAPNPIAAENCLPGNPQSEWDVTAAGDPSIQGFATDISVNRGSTVSFKIKTDAAAYRLDIYRLGYYGGMGARKLATVLPSVALPQSQPACLTNASTGLIDCGNWAVSASWPVPAGATSGIYFARLVRSDTGGASHIVFVVRDDASTSDLLFQTSDTTWQAYNEYGGNSLYTRPGANPPRAFAVSYNRPFNTRAVDGGQDWLFNAEYPMLRWLEANGYDVTYFTGVDSDRFGSLIPNHKVFLSVGHDEYWSAAQRANVESARDAGVSLAFFSGNEVFWKTRWESSIDGSGTPYRTLVSYKETHANAKIDPEPSIWTGTWRDPRFSPPADGGRPENALTGTIFMVNNGATTAIQVPADDGKMRFWRNTGIDALGPGATATLAAETLGYEWDADLDNGFRPAGLIRLSTTTVANAPVLLDYGSSYGSGTVTHNLTLYRKGNALVFGAGTVQWAWGLDNNHDRGSTAPDVRMQQATVNLFADMLAQPATLHPGLVQATASTDTAPPASSITSPAAGAIVPLGTPLTVSGTAADNGGGRVGAVEVSFDGGTRWHPATGRGAWSYTWTPATAGALVIMSRAVDDSGILEVATAGITIAVGDATPPAAPGGLTAAGSGAGISLAWNANTEADLAGYNVYRGASSGGSFIRLNTGLLAITSYIDSAAPAGAVSYYRVTAVDTSGNESSPATANALRPDVAPPAPPAGLTATASTTGINLVWSANAEADLAGYNVYRSQSASGPFARINASPVATTSYQDTLAPQGTSFYQITALDLSGLESAPSADASAAMAKANRMQNPGFELDADGDGRPDAWSTHAAFTRNNVAPRGGTYAGLHSSSGNVGYTLAQTLPGLSARTSYTFAGWVYIPATTDNFKFQLQIRWRNATNRVITTKNVRTLSAGTGGWMLVTSTQQSPSGTASAEVLMVTSSLSATVYVDEFAFR